MEYWIVYDVATGAVLYRGSGSAGTAAFQQLPDGAAILLVPLAVVGRPELDLVALRLALAARIDVQAEARRQRFLTAGDGQAMTYARKEAEARAWMVDHEAPVPFLDAEAAARGMTVALLADEVVALADRWVLVGAAIEASRMGAKTRVAAAPDFAAIVAAHAIDWSTIDAITH